MRGYVLALVGLACAAPALGQLTYGNVEFRWRERALGLGSGTVLPQGAQGVANPAGVSQSLATLTNTADARFTLILEARVRRVAAYPDLRGLLAAEFSVVSSDTIRASTFARAQFDTQINQNGWPEGGNGLSVGSSQTMYNFNVGTGEDNYLPFPTGGVYTNGYGSTVTDTYAGRMVGQAANDRGIYGLFRGVASTGAANTGAIGTFRSSNGNRLDNVTLIARTEFYTPYLPNPDFDPDDPLTGPQTYPGVYAGRSDFYGVDKWIPVYALQYNVADVTTPRDIVLTVPQPNPSDTGLRGFRGVTRPAAGGTQIDVWNLSGSIPSYTITVVPAPGAALPIVVMGLVAARRRRA